MAKPRTDVRGFRTLGVPANLFLECKENVSDASWAISLGFENAFLVAIRQMLRRLTASKCFSEEGTRSPSANP